MLKRYLERTSVRDFTDKRFSSEELELISKVINNSPTSTNSQQFSAIIINDQETKDFISKNNWNQKHISDSAAFILFIADKSRINYFLKQENIMPPRDIVEHDWFRGVIDATIAATYAHDALMELGYGVTFVGGVLAFAEELKDKLDLPNDSVVVVGLSIGWPSKTNALKPKMNKVFINKYNKEVSIKEAINYDQETAAYFEERNSLRYSKRNVAQNKPESGFGKAGKYINKSFKEYK